MWEWPFTPITDALACVKRHTAETDRTALLELYSALGGPSWSRRSGWDDPAVDVSMWEGVTVLRGRVVMLRLRANGLDGKLPVRALARLDALRWLDLSANSKLRGAVPPPWALGGGALDWLDLSKVWRRR